MRLSATKAILERKDTLIVATVSSIYGYFDPLTGQVLRRVPRLTADALIAAGIPVLLAIPTTTRLFPGTEPLRILISARDRLLKNSYLMLEQLRTLDRSRFGDGPLTCLTAQEMAVVEKGLKGVMGMQ